MAAVGSGLVPSWTGAATGGQATSSAASSVVSAAPTAAPTAATSSDIDPDGAPARYVNRLCASGKVLSTLGATATTPQVTGDPTVARREFLDSTSRTLGVLDAALADLVPLRDEAPTPQVETAFSLVVDEFTAARRSFTDAHDTVEASDPLTPQAYRAGGAKVADGVRNLSFAAALIKEITLPPEYTDASAVAPQCQVQ